jgi:hypothetical protein
MVCSPSCSWDYTKQLKSKEWKKKKAKMKEDLQTVQELTKIVQQVFNKYIRLRDAGQVCISCQKKPKKENAGHFYSSGGHKNVTFDEFNVHLQCEFCNTHLHGNLIPFRASLIKKIGLVEFQLLESRANKTRKFSREELKEILEIYKKKIADLK